MRPSSAFRSKRHHASFLIAWIGLSLFGIFMALNAEIKKTEQQFSQDVHEVSNEIFSKLETNDAVISGFSAFLQAVEVSDQYAAARYAAAAMAPYPHIYMLEVARQIEKTEQAQFQTTIRASGQPDFLIKNFADITGRSPIYEAPTTTIWPIIFMYPVLSVAEDLYGTRLESIPYLSETLRFTPFLNRAIASPVFQLKEGGGAYILLRQVHRNASQTTTNTPNLFGSSMVALLLSKTSSLQPDSTEQKNLDLTAELISDSSEIPSPLFKQNSAAAGWLDQKILPIFSRTVESENASQPVRLSYQRQLRFDDILSTSTLTMLCLLLTFTLLIAYYIRRDHRAIELATQEHQRAEYLAMHDALTDLPNRHLLIDRAEQLFERWHRHGSRFALFILDLDHFKNINDSLGHEAGDAVLIATARRIAQTLRGSDTVARYGGDEFVVLIADVLSNDDALALGEKLCGILSQPIMWGETATPISCSLGIALCPDDGKDFKALFQQADEAMYQVKTGGRNGARLATQTA